MQGLRVITQSQWIVKTTLQVGCLESGGYDALAPGGATMPEQLGGAAEARSAEQRYPTATRR